MTKCNNILYELLLLIIFVQSNGKILDTKWSFETRLKRYLVYKEGINWVQLIVGIGLPVEIENHSVTLGSVIKAYYLLPTNSTDYTNPTYNVMRKKRMAKHRQVRWDIYEMLESYINRMGYGDGKSCLLRQICEVTSNPFEYRWGILSEILEVLLTPSLTPGDFDNHLNGEYLAAEKLGKEGANCFLLFPGCKGNFMEPFTKMHEAYTNL